MSKNKYFKPKAMDTAPPQEKFGLPEIDPEEIEFEKDPRTGEPRRLGKGAYGQVLAAKCRQQMVAVKILKNQTMDRKGIEAFKKEISNVSRLYHPNICLFMGACTQPGNLMIVTELVRGGDLESLLLRSKRKLTMTLRMKMARDAALGMNWLHSSHPKFIHRDLKPSNLLYDENMRVKVCDFGLSQMLSTGEQAQDDQTAKGTPMWMAPEVLMFRPFDESCDVYSFGLVLWVLMTRQEPYTQFRKLEEFRTAVCQHHVRPPIADEYNRDFPALVELIEACWQPDASARPTFAQIIDHLDIVIVHSAVDDELGRAFWIQHFAKEDPVKWEAFLPAFLGYLQVDQLLAQAILESPGVIGEPEPGSQVDDPRLATAVLRVRCLKELLIDRSDGEDVTEIVRLSKYGKVLDLFSPVQGAEVLNEIHDLMKEPWFFGMLTSQEAEQRLANTSPGCFLVRFSSTESGSVVISLVSQERSLQHLRIKHVPGEGFFFRDRPERFEHLSELVAHIGPQVGLLIPSKSPFQALFAETPFISEGYKEVQTFDEDDENDTGAAAMDIA